MFENVTVLVVDDSYSTAMVLSQILRHELKFGNVLNASNGEQALELFETNQVDWVFSDIEMPEMNGLDLLAAIREQSRGRAIPVVLMSAHTDKATIARAMGAGATDFIAKPFNAASVIEKVKRIGLQPAAGEAAPRQRRRAARMRLARALVCRVRFSADIEYVAELINVSVTGLLLRSRPFTQGGTIYDPARLSIEAGALSLAVKATLRRLEADKTSESNNKGLMVLAGFHFIGLDASTLNGIKALITQQAAQSPGG